MYKFVEQYEDDIIDEMQLRIDNILKLEEEARRESSIQNSKLHSQMKHLYDKRAIERKFEIGDMVLMWNARMEDKGKYGKFDPIWVGPYNICDTNGEDSLFLKDLIGDILELLVHGQLLKRYFSQKSLFFMNASFRVPCFLDHLVYFCEYFCIVWFLVFVVLF